VTSARARVAAWTRQHPRLVLVGLLVLVTLACWGGYQGKQYFQARSHYQAAQQAVDRHDWKEAREQLKDALQLWPNRSATHLLAARVERRLEHLSDAAKHLDECQRLEGSETQAIKVERALLRVHRGELAAVEEFLRACVKQDDPDTVEILDILSAGLYLNYRIAESQRCLDELLQRRPDDFDFLVRRGKAAENMGWYADAVQHYQKALRLRPDVDNVRLFMAEILIALGRFEEAQEHFDSLRVRQPNHPSVLFGVARCQANLGQKEKAIPLLDQLLAADPRNWKMLSERGWLAVQLDRLQEGETYLRKAESLAPPDLTLRTHLADCLRLLDKKEDAREMQEKADKLKADLQRAGELGDRIREKKPNDPELRYELGVILLGIGKREDAVHWLQTALEKDPAHRKTHEQLQRLGISTQGPPR